MSALPRGGARNLGIRPTSQPENHPENKERSMGFNPSSASVSLVREEGKAELALFASSTAISI
jgi:hypothetical protein